MRKRDGEKRWDGADVAFILYLRCLLPRDEKMSGHFRDGRGANQAEHMQSREAGRET